jgi:hypothetical protein
MCLRRADTKHSNHHSINARPNKAAATCAKIGMPESSRYGRLRLGQTDHIHDIAKFGKVA